MKVNVSHDGERNDGTNKELNPFTSSTSNVGSIQSNASRRLTTLEIMIRRASYLVTDKSITG